jgi:acyl carrier protein
MVSRCGPTSPEAFVALAAFGDQGVQVRDARVDVADPNAVADLFEEITSTAPPLRGVFHAAMLLDDGLLGQMDAARFDGVMRPKALGAWHLHQHTQALSLDAFVLFSSVSALMGTTGQASYATANAFLDGLAQYRRGLGLPGLSVNWGAIKDVGVVACNAAIESHLSRLGVRGIAARSALDAVSLPLAQHQPQAMIADIDWRVWLEANATVARAPRFTEVTSAFAEGAAPGGTSAFIAALREAQPSARQALVESLLSELLARIMRMPPSQVEREIGLGQLGVDSLMVVEFNSAIMFETGVEVPAIELLRGPSIADLSTWLLDRVVPPENDLLATVHELPEEELDALLRELLQDDRVGSPS